MDNALVSVFSEAARNTFRDMFGLEAKLLGAHDLGPSDEHGWDLTGLIGLAGHVQGVVAIRLTGKLTERLLAGSGVKAASDAERRQLESGLVGELCNIIAGAASSSASGLDFEIAPPVVIRGPNHKIGWPSIAPVVALSFGLDTGSFELDVCVKA
jgi:CheY-specific phosphatase CheX